MKIHVEMWDRKYYKYRTEIIDEQDLEFIAKQKIKEYVDIHSENLDSFKIDKIEP